MKENKLLIPQNLLFLFAIIGGFFTLFTISLDFTSIGITLPNHVLLIIGIIFSFIAILITIKDVFKNNLKNKTIWIITFIIFGAFGVLFYLSNRPNALKI